MKAALVPVVLALALAGCASTGKLTTAENLAAYQGHAGDPVPSFQFFGSLQGWTELGDAHLAVQTRPGEAWLLSLHGNCPGLEWARNIGLTSQFNRVHARLDKVIVPEESPIGCRIQTIQPLDTRALKDELRNLRQARIEQRAQDGQGD